MEGSNHDVHFTALSLPNANSSQKGNIPQSPCSGYSSPNSSRGQSMSPPPRSPKGSGLDISPQKRPKKLSEVTFDIAAVCTSETERCAVIDGPKGECPMIYAMVPIWTQDEFMDLLHEELLSRQQINNSLRAELGHRYCEFIELNQALCTKLLEYQKRCDSIMRTVLSKGGKAQCHRIRRILDEEALNTPQQSIELRRKGEELMSNRNALIQHDHSSFYLWKRQLLQWFATVGCKLQNRRSETLTAWERAETERVKLRNSVEAQKVQEYLLRERIQIQAELTHHQLANQRLAVKWWRGTARTLREFEAASKDPANGARH